MHCDKTHEKDHGYKSDINHDFENTKNKFQTTKAKDRKSILNCVLFKRIESVIIKNCHLQQQQKRHESSALLSEITINIIKEQFKSFRGFV
jgi:hypothetical protein